MLAEFIIGRKSQKNPAGAFRAIAGNNRWSWIGLMGVVSAFLILSFYFVVAGWSLEYVYQAIKDAFSHASIDELDTVFMNFTTYSNRPILWIVVFIAMSAGIILMGVQKGIERSSKILMPLLFVILIFLAISAILLPNSSAGLAFYFRMDFASVTPNVILSALGQAFFSLSLGMGCMITYGSYIQKDANLPKIAMQTSVLDTLIAILSGLIIFPAVFSLGIDPAQGPRLVFITLPAVFGQMPGGYIIAILFFILLTVAALTSTISLMEVIAAYVTEERGWSRRKVVVWMSVILIVTSILCSLSLKGDTVLKIGDVNLFDLFDYLTSKFLMPFGGLCVALFVGWYMKKDDVRMELLNGKESMWFSVYMFLLRYFVPLAIILIFLNELGLSKLFGGI